MYNKDKSDEKRGSKLCRLYQKKAPALLAKVQKVPEAQLGTLCSGGNGICICRNILPTIIIAALDIFLEIKLHRCPHCGKGLDCRRRVNETRFARSAKSISPEDCKGFAAEQSMMEAEGWVSRETSGFSILYAGF